MTEFLIPNWLFTVITIVSIVFAVVATIYGVSRNTKKDSADAQYSRGRADEALIRIEDGVKSLSAKFDMHIEACRCRFRDIESGMDAALASTASAHKRMDEKWGSTVKGELSNINKG